MADSNRCLNLAEILEELENDTENEVREIFIEPPEPNVLSDEDSADDGEGGLIDNLTSRQLSAMAEVVFNNDTRMGHDDPDSAFATIPPELFPLLEDEVPDESVQDVVPEVADDFASVVEPSIADQLIPACVSTKNSIEKASTSSNSYPIRKRKIQNAKKNVQVNLNISKKKKTKDKTSCQAVPKRKWSKNDLSPPVVQLFPESDYSKYSDFSPVELFELFFDEELFDMIMEEIKRYASFKNVPDPNVDISELKCFFGVLIVSGYNPLPGKRFYWETSDDVRNHLISTSIRRNRFTQIMSLLHFVDNTKMDATDKIWKLRPLLEKLRVKFREHFVPVRQLDFDESMIAYYGRHSCKQFLRGKPIRFGYKAWCLNTYSGYLIDFMIYQGKSAQTNDPYDKAFGKSAAPLVRMLDELEISKKEPYHIYFDNLFTGMNLLVHLRKKNVHGTGTIRANRVPEDCDIISPKQIKKKDRGYYDYCVSDDQLVIARWQDNAPVTVASTIHGVEPTTNVKRYSKLEKKTVQIQRPSLIGEYNKFMGGTDLMDENVNRYRVNIRSKKWWWPIFTWCVDVTLQNSWYLYNMSHRPKMTQLEFKRAIAVHYLKTHGTAAQFGGRPSNRPQSTPAFNDLQTDGLNHFVVQNEGNKKRRCAGADCKSIIRTSCKKCCVGLCIPCFLPYHLKK